MAKQSAARGFPEAEALPTGKRAFAGFGVTQLCPGNIGFEIGTDYPFAGCSSARKQRRPCLVCAVGPGVTTGVECRVRGCPLISLPGVSQVFASSSFPIATGSIIDPRFAVVRDDLSQLTQESEPAAKSTHLGTCR